MTQDSRLPWIALLILLAALGISFLVTARLAFLNFFYLPVLLVAYWSGRRMATLLAVLSVLFVAFVAWFYPSQFTLEQGGSAGFAWLNLLVWGCFLILAAYVSGTFMERLRSRERQEGERPSGPDAESPARPEVQLYNIGTLAIIKGYLRHDQVLKILQIQQKNRALFGEIAVGLRLLTTDQVNELLQLQKEKRSVTLSEIAMARLEIAKARKGG